MPSWVGLLSLGGVKARDHVLDAKDAASDLGHHEVGVVVAGYSGDDVAVFDARLLEHLLVEAHALDGGAVEVMAEGGKGVRAAVDDRDVVAVVREKGRQVASHAAAADDDDVHRASSAVVVVSRGNGSAKQAEEQRP